LRPRLAPQQGFLTACELKVLALLTTGRTNR
jgi:hypothetical protein